MIDAGQSKTETTPASASRALLQHRPQHAFELGRLPRETEIGGMRAVHRALAVVAQQIGAFQIVNLSHILRFQRGKCLAQRRMVRLIRLCGAIPPGSPSGCCDPPPAESAYRDEPRAAVSRPARCAP
jgi:hypothetical protein